MVDTVLDENIRALVEAGRAKIKARENAEEEKRKEHQERNRAQWARIEAAARAMLPEPLRRYAGLAIAKDQDLRKDYSPTYSRYEVEILVPGLKSITYTILPRGDTFVLEDRHSGGGSGTYLVCEEEYVDDLEEALAIASPTPQGRAK